MTFLPLRSYTCISLCVMVLCLLCSCFGKRGITEVKYKPYAVDYEDDSTLRLSDQTDEIFVEVRATSTSKPMENLAIHYPALFPGGEIIRPGDREEYVRINGHTAYKVTFGPKYIRKRKRIPEAERGKKTAIPEGWTATTMEDPVSGKPIPVMYGPVIPQQKILYLVQGKSRVYYILMKADGDSIEKATRSLDSFVKEGIDYQ